MLKKMIKLKTTALLVVLMFAITSMAQKISIIPQPVSLIEKKGQFRLPYGTSIKVMNKEDQKAADFLNNYLKKYYGFTLPERTKDQRNSIILITKTFIKA